jgi:hypothetical protein
VDPRLRRSGWLAVALAFATPVSGAQALGTPVVVTQVRFSEAIPLWDALPKPTTEAGTALPQRAHAGAKFVLYRVRLSRAQYDTGKFLLDTYSCVYINHVPDFAGGAGREAQRPLETLLERRIPGWPMPCHDRGQIGGTGGSASAQPQDEDKSFWYEILVDVQTSEVNEVAGQSDVDGNDVRYLPPPKSFGTLKWYTHSLPMRDPFALKFRRTRCIGACFYRGKLELATPVDLRLDTSQLTHGLLWVNGHASVGFGENKSVRVPAGELHAGVNEVIVFDMDGDPFATIQAKTEVRTGP